MISGSPRGVPGVFQEVSGGFWRFMRFYELSRGSQSLRAFIGSFMRFESLSSGVTMSFRGFWSFTQIFKWPQKVSGS